MKTLTNILGIACEIESSGGFTDITIKGDTDIKGERPRLFFEWIVRRAPEPVAEQIAAVVIQHLLETPEAPESLMKEVKLSQDEQDRLSQGGVVERSLTPEEEAWFRIKREVSHEYHADEELNFIRFWKGYDTVFTLTHKTTASNYSPEPTELEEALA
jgi:hypothetical protein